MNYKIVILAQARSDFKKSVLWFKEIDPKLAKRFLLSFNESVLLLKKNPFQFQIRYDDVRIIVLTTFPYLIHYAIYQDIVVIKAIFHSSRDSKLEI